MNRPTIAYFAGKNTTKLHNFYVVGPSYIVVEQCTSPVFYCFLNTPEQSDHSRAIVELNASQVLNTKYQNGWMTVIHGDTCDQTSQKKYQHC